MSGLSRVSRSEHCLMHDTAQRRPVPKHNNTQPYTFTHSTTYHSPASSPSISQYSIHAGLGAQVLRAQHHSQDACGVRVDFQHDCVSRHGRKPQLNRAQCSTAPPSTTHPSQHHMAPGLRMSRVAGCARDPGHQATACVYPGHGPRPTTQGSR